MNPGGKTDPCKDVIWMDPERSYRDHRHELFNYFRRCGVTREASEDLLQETFLALLEEPGRFEPRRGTLRFFLFGIARNMRRAWERKRRFRGEVPEVILDRSAGTHWEPENVLSVRAAVLELPEEQRETVLLREFHGFTYEEIASLQEVPVGTVRSRLARAREGLRLKLAAGSRDDAGRRG